MTVMEKQMRHSTKIVQVYAELRDALGDTVPAGELFAMAERLVDAAGRRETIDRCGRIAVSVLDIIAIDSAMRDGGWALLDAPCSIELFDDDGQDLSWQPRGHNSLIRLIGQAA